MRRRFLRSARFAAIVSSVALRATFSSYVVCLRAVLLVKRAHGAHRGFRMPMAQVRQGCGAPRCRAGILH